jgi:hypothetical protein
LQGLLLSAPLAEVQMRAFGSLHAFQGQSAAFDALLHIDPGQFPPIQQPIAFPNVGLVM